MLAELLPIPKCGPAIYSVRGFQNVSVPAAGSVGPIEFKWPRAVFVTGVKILAQEGTVAAQARLSLRIQDETFRDIISDWTASNQFIPGVALGGRALSRSFAVQRPVLDGDAWFLTIANSDAGGAHVIACVHLTFDNGLR